MLPIARARDEYFVRDVTAEVVELGKSSGQAIGIPAHRIADILAPGSDGLGVLELDGRLQWLSISRR